MSKDRRAEIVEAMARAMCHAVHPCKSMVAEIMADTTYLSGREGDAAALTLAGQFRVEAEAALDIALKSAAGIAGGWKSSLRPGSQDRLSGHLEARRDIADAILALTSEGVKE